MKPAFPVRPRKNTHNKKVVFEGVEAMPVEEGVEGSKVLQQSHQIWLTKVQTRKQQRKILPVKNAPHSASSPTPGSLRRSS